MSGIAHLGSRTLVAGLWDRLGTSTDWGLAVHPYGPSDASTWPRAYHFADLHRVVDYQLARLAAANASHAARRPQAFVAATEQGWPAAGDAAPAAARQLCLATAAVLATPGVMFAVHNDFQGVRPDDGRGLVPFEAGAGLNTTAAALSPTLAAHASAAPGVWGAGKDHYCCAMHGLGCPGVAPARR